MIQTRSNDVTSQSLPDGIPPHPPSSLGVDGVGLLSAAQWNCGIGRRYHSTVCHNAHSRHNVSAAQCAATGPVKGDMLVDQLAMIGSVNVLVSK